MGVIRSNFTERILVSFSKFKLIYIGLIFFLLAMTFPEIFNLPIKQSSQLNAIVVSEGYKGFYIVRFNDKYYGWARSLGPLHLNELRIENIKQYEEFCNLQELCVSADSLEEVRRLLDRLIPVLVKANEGCNIFAYSDEFFISCVTSSSLEEAEQIMSEMIRLQAP